MMKSNSLKNRLLALALTLVMVLGMLPSDFVSAEDAAPAEPDSTVVTDGNVWLIGDTYYATLQAAVDAASAEGQTTIKLAGNAFGPGAVVNGSKNIVIDFNSKTYSLTEPVGSTGTESNGLQLLAGSAVTLMNGTLQVAEANKYDFYILVQNYGNLNVSSMILDGTNLDKWSGSDGDSYALSINSGEVAIDGSTIKANNEGAYAYAFDVCEYGSYAAPSVTVYSGSIEGKIDTSAIGGAALSIKGGSFTVPASVTKYVAAGYKMNSSGEVTKAAAVWQVGEDTYTTLQEAVDAAPAGGTITLLGNASGAGAVVNKSVTIDFGGYTYSLVEPVGSTGTKSNGLQLLAGNDVTLKNGTLEAAARFSSEFYILVQNYANLTVSNMNLYGEGLDKYAFTDQDSYVLSINSGKVLIENTNIYANTTGSLAYAFDVCKYGSYAAPQVTVTGGCFEGSIDTSSFKDNAPLTITGGTYTDIHTAEQYLADGYKLVISEEKGTVALDTIVTPLNGGEVEQLEDGTIVVAVENQINLVWSDPLGDSVGGWWAGIKVQAPVSLTADQLAKSTYTVNDGETEVFMDHIVSEEGETPYIKMWIKLNHEIIENDDDGVVTENYVFNWAGEEQTVVFEIQTANVNLIQDTDQDKLYFAQEEVNVVYDQNLIVPVETLHGGSGNGVVTYNVISEDGDEIVELVTAEDGTVSVAVKKIGTVTIQATKAASGPYALATATYTLTINPRPVTVYVNSCSKTYGEENPQFTYSLSEEGLDAYVTFVDIPENVVAGSYDLIVDEAYIRENGEKSDNYVVTIEDNQPKLTVKRAERVVTFTNDENTVVFGTKTYSNPIQYDTLVGEQTVTYKIVKADGIEASVDGQGTVTLGTTKVLEQDATVIVSVFVAADDGYEQWEDTYRLTVKAFMPSDNVFTFEGEKGTNDWYISDVTLKPSAGYEVGFGTKDEANGGWITPAVWNDSLVLNQEGEDNEYFVFLRNEAGHISVPQTVSGIKIDKTDPDVKITYVKNVIFTISDQIFFITQNPVDVKVEFSDNESGIFSVKIDCEDDNLDKELSAEEMAAGVYTFSIAPQYRGTVKVEVADNSSRSNSAATDEVLVVDNETLLKAEFTGYNKYDEEKNVTYSSDPEFGIVYTITESNVDLLEDKKLTVQIDENDSVAYTIQEDKTVWIPLDVPGEHTIKATFTDVAGNQETLTHTYLVDDDNPVIHDLTFNDENVVRVNKATEEAPDYIYLSGLDSLVVGITVSDFNYGLINPQPVVTITHDNGKAVEQKNLTWTPTEKDGNSGAYAQLTDLAEGMHEITVSYDDGLHEVSRTFKVCVDLNPPEINFEQKPNPVGDEPDITYYSNDEQFNLDITITDHNYGVSNDHPVVKLGEETIDVVWKHEDGEASTNLPHSVFKVGENVVTVTYTDGLHEVAKTYKIVLDYTKPVIDVQLSETKLEPNGDRAYYTGNVTAAVSITEANFDPRLVEVAVTAKDADGKDVEISDYTAAAKASEWTKDGDKYTLELTFTAEANYTLTVDYTDQATNAAEQIKKEFTIDHTNPDAPVITYSASVPNAIWNQISGGFFNEELNVPAVVTITVEDATAGVKEFIVSSSDMTFIEKEKVVPAEQDGSRSTASFTIPAQYNGTLTVVAVDWANNQNTTEDEYLAIVDTVDPVANIQLNPEVKTANEVKYFNGDIVMNVTINETNYAFFENAEISVEKDGRTYTGGTQTGWVRGPVATNTLTLTEDGDYNITVTYHDGSNNEMPTWTSGKLTLDTTAPVITVTNVKQNSANKDETYGFMITVTDINLDVDSVKPVLKAVVKGEDGMYKTQQIDLGKAQIDAEGETAQFTVENLPEDALYTLTCSAKDMSDNETTEILLADGKAYETVNFSINRNGSTFGFGNDFTEALVNQYYVYSVYEDVILVEVNVDPIENYTITVNGVELVEGTDYDYTTKQSSDPGEWSMNTYIISKDYFAKQGEGQYNIVVSSTDKANTTAYSDIKNLAVAFVVDQTAPVLTISGLQEGGRYQTTEQTVTLIPTDEGGSLNSLKILIMDSDGEPLTDDAGNDISVRFDLSGEELFAYLEENGGMVTFTIPTGLEMQVQIICNDCAVNAEGLTNEYNETFKRVTVSENAFIIFYANKPAFYGTISGVVVLAAAAVILIKRRKTAK